jgi:hypothetical protein
VTAAYKTSAAYETSATDIWYISDESEVLPVFTLLELKVAAVEALSKAVDHFPTEPARYNVLACTSNYDPRLKVLVSDKGLDRAVQVALASPSRVLDIQVADRRKLHCKVIERRTVLCTSVLAFGSHLPRTWCETRLR